MKIQILLAACAMGSVLLAAPNLPSGPITKEKSPVTKENNVSEDIIPVPAEDLASTRRSVVKAKKVVSKKSDEVLYKELLKKLEERAAKQSKKENVKRAAVVDSSTKASLPEPFKSILIGNSIAVFAHYNEIAIRKNANPDSVIKKSSEEDLEAEKIIGDRMRKTGEAAKNIIGNNRQKFLIKPKPNLTYSLKDIRIYIGSQFGEWEVTKLTSHYVVYTNIINNSTVKKYY